FFGRSLAHKLAREGKRADLLLVNNVLAQVPDINDFVAGIEVLLKPGGVVTMEFPHLIRLMEENQFDTIYHEHYSYLSFTAVEQIFAAHGLVLFDVEELTTHGGSLRIYGRHTENDGRAITANVIGLREREKNWGIEEMRRYQGFAAQGEAAQQIG